MIQVTSCRDEIRVGIVEGRMSKKNSRSDTTFDKQIVAGITRACGLVQPFEEGGQELCTTCAVMEDTSIPTIEMLYTIMPESCLALFLRFMIRMATQLMSCIKWCSSLIDTPSKYSRAEVTV
jgi:hypothetical protein